MKTRLLLTLSITLAAFHFCPTYMFGQPAPIKKLREIADELKHKGLDTAPPHIVEVNHGPALSFEDLVSLSPVIVSAQHIDFVYRMNADSTDIETVLKFQIGEIFRGEGLISRMKPEEQMPARTRRLGRLTADEFLLFQSGGFLVVNGVRFRTVYTGTPKFEVGKWYLLFLKKLPSDPQFEPEYYGTNLYYSVLGPRGAFQIANDYSTLEGLDVPGSHQRTELLNRFLKRADPFFQFLRDEVRRQGERSRLP